MWKSAGTSSSDVTLLVNVEAVLSSYQAHDSAGHPDFAISLVNEGDVPSNSGTTEECDSAGHLWIPKRE